MQLHVLHSVSNRQHCVLCREGSGRACGCAVCALGPSSHPSRHIGWTCPAARFASCRAAATPSPWGPLYGTEALDPSGLRRAKAAAVVAMLERLAGEDLFRWGRGRGSVGGGGQGLQQHLSQGMVLHGQGGVQDAYPISEVRGCVSQGVPHHDCFPCLPAGSMWPALCRSPYSTSPPAQRQQQGSSRHQQGRAPATPGSSTRRLSSMSWAGGGRLLGL